VPGTGLQVIVATYFKAGREAQAFSPAARPSLEIGRFWPLHELPSSDEGGNGLRRHWGRTLTSRKTAGLHPGAKARERAFWLWRSQSSGNWTF